MSRRSRPEGLKVVGKTTDGKFVVEGMFRLVDTHGIPLEVVVDVINDHGLVPSWTDFYDRSIKAGWNPTSTYQKLVMVVGDVYGPEYRVEWERRMKLYIEAG